MVRDRTAFFESLEKLGETEVRARLAEDKFAEQRKALAHEWLRRKEEDRSLAAADRFEAIESSKADIALSQLREARKANRIAIAAAIIAVISAIISIIGSCSSST